MGHIVIACYRPLEGKRDALDALCRTHFSRLYAQGLVTRRRPVVMRAGDGTLLEVFEWKSPRAVEEAHENPAVQQMWREYGELCEYVPVGTLAEAGELFSAFAPVDFDVEVPKVSRIYNQVQVSERIGTSGALRRGAVADIAEDGYSHIIDLLPADNQHALRGEAEIARQHGLAYHHIPVDFGEPTEADFVAFAEAMEAARPGKVWVHCAANYRVTAFMALYGRRHLGWDTARAEELIGEVWQPDPVWRRFLEQMA